MSKSSVFENKAFQQTAPSGIGFNLIPQTSNFNSVFNTKPLDVIEAARIERLLEDGFLSEAVTEEQGAKDLVDLKQITAEIKAIGKQGTVLMGERVHRARELLKPYKDGTFTRWLEAAFGTRKTGYNMLSYYELYTALPQDDLRDRFRKLQQRTAYILASREGSLETKAEIISEYHDKSHDELLVLIQEKLPSATGDRRTKKNSVERLLASLQEGVKKLQGMRDLLTTKNGEEIRVLRDSLSSVISVQSSV